MMHHNPLFGALLWVRRRKQRAFSALCIRGGAMFNSSLRRDMKMTIIPVDLHYLIIYGKFILLSSLV